MNPLPRRSASSSGVTNRTLTDTSGFTPRRPDLGPWPQYERVDSNHQPPAYQTGAPTIAPRSLGRCLRLEDTRALSRIRTCALRLRKPALIPRASRARRRLGLMSWDLGHMAVTDLHPWLAEPVPPRCGGGNPRLMRPLCTFQSAVRSWPSHEKSRPVGGSGTATTGVFQPIVGPVRAEFSYVL